MRGWACPGTGSDLLTGECMMFRRVLVTGGCGYIGSVLVASLLERGYTVRVLDKLYFGDDALGEVRDRVELVAGDVRTVDESVLDDVWAVAHLGSLSNDPTSNFYPEASESINYYGTVRLAELCRQRRIERFTFASTCAVYGFWLEREADENEPTAPQGAYAGSKLDAERYLLEHTGDAFHPTVLRQATVFGLSPRMRWDIVLNAFVMHGFRYGKLDVWFGGDAWRPLVHVRDVADAHIRCLESPLDVVSGQVFNLVYGNYLILDLASRVRDVLIEEGIDTTIAVNSDLRDSRSYKVSGEKLAHTIGFRPDWSPGDGAREVVRFLKAGHLQDFDHPIYYNLPWMRLLLSIEDRISRTGPVF